MWQGGSLQKNENQLKHGQQNPQCKPYIEIKILVSYLYGANSTCWLMLWDAVKGYRKRE